MEDLEEVRAGPGPRSDPDRRCLQVAWGTSPLPCWTPADCTFNASPEGGGGAKAVGFCKKVLEQFTQKVFDPVKADQQRPCDSLAVSMATLHAG